MRLSIYLHKDIYDILNVYGDINTVINRALNDVDDYEDKPDCGPRDGCNRYNIDVTNEQYLQLLKIYGVKSKRISLRRFIYWFVENEMYNELGWEPVKDYLNSDQLKINKQVDKIINELDKLSFICKDNGIVSHAKDLILSIKR